MRESITAEDIISLMESMSNNASFNELFKKLDDTFSPEVLHYMQNRGIKRADSNLNNQVPGTIISAFAEICREEKTTVTYALAMICTAHHILGQRDLMDDKKFQQYMEIIEEIFSKTSRP